MGDCYAPTYHLSDTHTYFTYPNYSNAAHYTGMSTDTSDAQVLPTLCTTVHREVMISGRWIDPAVLSRKYTGELGDLRCPQTPCLLAYHAEYRGDRAVRLPAEEHHPPHALGREVQDPVLHYQLRAHLQCT